MLDAGRQIWEIRVPKDVKLSPLKNKMSKNKTKMIKKKGNQEKWKMEKMRRKRDEWKDNKNDLSWNDPWCDHLETQFGPTYPFFRNPEPRPTLRT